MNAPLPTAVTATITVTVNGTPHTTTAHTLAQWVEQQDQSPLAVATALNGEFVPRGLRAQRSLAEGDTIVTFQPIEGG